MRITQWVPVSIAILIIFYLAFTQTERKQVFASKPLKKAERTVSIRKDQVRDVEYIGTFRSYSRQYKFIRYKDNFLTFNTPPADVQILSALSEADSRKVRITHIGDSHIQCDIMTGVIREKLQAAFGYAGRGFIFPYRVAGSNNPEDYSVSSTGSWIYSRNTHAVAILPTGASGYSVQTSNPQAGITFNFRNPTNKALGNEVKVWCQTGESDFEPRLVLDDTVIVAPQALEKGKSYYTFKLPTAVTQQLRLKIAATKSTQRTFTLHGLTLENADSTGIVYSSMGVNGARISAYLNAPLLKTQLQAMQPDMVVLDIGVNDYYARPCLPVYVADSLQELIDQVSNAVPNATILLTSQQPTAYKRKTVPATLAFAQTVKDLNKQNFKVGLYDFFTVTNSRQAVEYWEGYKMMQKDGIHLTHTGYTHKAELFTNALLGAYQQYLLKGKTCTPTTEPLVLNTIVGDDMDIAPSEANGLTNVADSAAQAANSEEESGLPDNGETPEAKPERKLTKKELKQKKLEEKRERQKEERALALKKQKKAEKRAALTGSIVPYVIQKGDNLTAIANKFHVSITSLQELNGMGKSVSITAGKTLKIPSR
jgi:lysophospholipase L1-like esterase/LysM repeat protein